MRDRPGNDSQDGVSQEQEDGPLCLPQINRHHETNVRGEDVSNVATIPVLLCLKSNDLDSDTQFTCFAGTKVAEGSAEGHTGNHRTVSDL